MKEPIVVRINDTGSNKAATELLIKAKAHVAGVEPTVDVRTVLISGTAGYALRKRSKKASLVVIGSGTHVRPGGRLTDRALQIASVALCPVAVIGEETENSRRGVVVGVDGYPFSWSTKSWPPIHRPRPSLKPHRQRSCWSSAAAAGAD
jgi:hypothetical protein